QVTQMAQGAQAAQPMKANAKVEEMSIDDLMAQLNVQGFRAGQEAAVNSDAIKAETSALAAGEKQQGPQADSDSKDDLTDDINPFINQTTHKQEMLSSSNNIHPGSPMIRSADDIANTRQVVETAQLLAQKGGGSMKIQLRPEGLGFVELKVGVNAGKVDIQM